MLVHMLKISSFRGERLKFRRNASAETKPQALEPSGEGNTRAAITASGFALWS